MNAGKKLGWMLVALALVAPAMAASKPGSISGYVKNSRGTPQMGASVEVFAPGGIDTLTVFTDARGYYRAAGLLPGVYFVKVTAASFLPTLRENVTLRSGAHLAVNLTLNTLFEAMELLPARRRASEDDDDWKWTLRSTANRPILRVLEDGPLVVVASTPRKEDRTLKARVAFLAGSDNEGFGSAGDQTAAFNVERSLFSSAATVSFAGNLGYGNGSPTTILRATYSHQLSNGSHPEVAVTYRRLATPDAATREAALEALALSLSDSTTLMDFVELNYGGELQGIQFRGRMNAFRPFGGVGVHLSPNTVVRYQYSTAQPTTRLAKGFDTAPADLTESGPRVTLVDAEPRLERARHQEISLSRRQGKNSLQVALYSDHISDVALNGAGVVSSASGEFLPDVYSNTFTFNGGNLDARGLRVVAERKLGANLTGTLRYAYGGVLELAGSNLAWDRVRSALRNQYAHAVSARMMGRVPRAGTRWIASYKWTSTHALTPVDMFDASPGQADPYLCFFIRQPLPKSSSLGHIEALIDVRNLLAEGYVPVFGQDGHTLYLMQAPRSVRGGLAFTF
ncbi:MAG: carboxypeptidase-like regulatory domain-containing protein [Terriglobales bacterium]